jgi:hypothetical protein
MTFLVESDCIYVFELDCETGFYVYNTMNLRKQNPNDEFAPLFRGIEKNK